MDDFRNACLNGKPIFSLQVSVSSMKNAKRLARSESRTDPWTVALLSLVFEPSYIYAADALVSRGLASLRKQHTLYSWPDLQGQGLFRPTLTAGRT